MSYISTYSYIRYYIIGFRPVGTKQAPSDHTHGVQKIKTWLNQPRKKDIDDHTQADEGIRVEHKDLIKSLKICSD